MKNRKLILITIFCCLSASCNRTRTKDRHGQEVPNTIPFYADSTVDLSNQNLERIPSEIYTRQNIKYLLLSQNNIQHVPDSIAFLKNLIKLDLSANRLDSFPKSVMNLGKLEYLDLSGNNILEVPQSLFQSRALRFLYLQSNSVTYLPDSLNTPKMEELYLNHNGLRNFFKYIGPNMVTVVDLSNNLIEILPNEFLNFKKLEVLNAGGNKITSIPTGLLSLPSLSYLFLQGNQIRNFDVNVSFSDNIREINLSHNPLNQNTKNLIKFKNIFKWN